MPYTKTDIYGASAELWALYSGLGTGGYWLSHLRQEIDFNTNIYTRASSTTAQQKLTQDLEAFFRNSVKTKPNWLRVFEPFGKKSLNSDSQIIEEILTVARLKQSTPLSIADLNWTADEALEIRSRLATFENDWNAPGMELYDGL